MKRAEGHRRVLEEVEKSDFGKVKVAVTDLDGILRGKYLHKDKFLSAVEGQGFGFCNVVFGWDSADVCYDNCQFTGWHSGYPDTNAKVDLSTFRKIPWEADLPFFIADFEDKNGEGLELCPRQLLKRVLKHAEKMGLYPMCGLEFEWFNFQETPESLNNKKYVSPQPLTPGMFGYSLLRSTLNQPYFTALMDDLAKFGIPLEGLHTETGPGVFEAAILFSDALEAADRGVLFKTAVKQIGYRFGIMPTFMAKWNVQLPGCSGHLHQSLWDEGRTKNLFYSETDLNRMSEVFKHYLAGQMALLPDLLPFFAPTVNSYKRLVEGYWAPTKVTWGIDNRTVAFRVISGSSKSTRLETRAPGSDINPYLAVAAAIGAGLYGIEKKLPLVQKAVSGSGYQDESAQKLSKNLYEATMKLQESKVAREIFGNAFVDHFVQTRLWEWRQFQNAVTNWELQRYFEII